MVMPLWFSVPGFFSAVVAIVGNGMVIFIITTKQRLHTTANWFILSLAVADFGLGVLFFPRSFLCDIEKMCLSDRNGKILLSFLQLFFCASTLNLWAMTFDRYIAVVKPLRYIALMTTRRVVSIVAMAWVFAFLRATTRFLIPVVMVPGHNQSTALRIFSGVSSTMYFLCGLFLVVATGHILYITWKHSQQIARIVAQLNFNQPESAPVITVNTSTQEASSAKLITTVVVVNLTCLIGSIVVISCPGKHPCAHSALGAAGALLLTVNSAVNPVVYALLKRDIRGELKRKFTRSVNVSD